MSNQQLCGEYEAYRATGGFVALEGWTTIALIGADRHSFLHNMCTNEINKLKPGEGCEAFLTDVKGKIQSHVFTLAGKEELLLITVPDQAQVILSHLDRYIIREDVQLEDRTSDLDWLLVSREPLMSTLASSSEITLLDMRGDWDHSRLTIAGIECLIANASGYWQDSVLLGCPTENRTEIVSFLNEAHLLEYTSSLSELIRIESDSPLFGSDFSAENLPQEVDRDAKAISFTKGCYLGQETVARIDALGRVNRKIVSIEFATLEGVDDVNVNIPVELSDSNGSVGQVTSVVWSPKRQKWIGLAMVKRGANESGMQLQSDLATATVISR